MKNRVITLLSLLCFGLFLFVGCQDDDNEQEIPTEQVTTSIQYKDIEAANQRIQAFVQDVFTLESGFVANRIVPTKSNDCVTTTSEVTETTRTITIDFGDGCEVGQDEVITGLIRMSFSVDLDAENKVTITYTVENFTYKDISVNGTATSIFTFDRDAGTRKFTTDSNFTFGWGDGLSATSATNFVNETFFEMNADAPGNFDFYNLTSGTSTTTFSNGDVYSVEITTPLRNERGCVYTVSGVVVTSENSDTSTLDYGDGTCDNLATLTDKDGNETTIEL
ncbi:hypothetical protein [Aquimarina spongiae]|uniref:Lipoprotein n=1 Tax=Aquimarina spongiae TaxID=570521 RepID=A0A1M6HLD6_9FLAO|nr:hypothetical protein [Aquimarina spongiae]SHJ23004.1 hypothetical protein SAMN04488508_106344 [Aquimarina spongiae]